MSSAPWTVGRLLQWTAEYLKTHGSDSARLDAEVLLAEALGCPRIQLYANFEGEPAEAQRAAYRELVRRRAEGAPVAYLVGHKEFYSLSFRVTPDVLIPRPETELLVVALLDAAKPWPPDRPLRIADVGTGSGILAVCAAKHLPRARVAAIDISAAALAVARANAQAHGVADRIDFVESDLFAGVAADKAFDFILSNPPYVAEAEVAALPPDVRNFEPKQALVAGPAGTEVIQRLIPQSADRLIGGGVLALEVSPMIHQAVVELLHADGRWETLPIVKDLARQPRVVMARRIPPAL